MKLPWQRPFHFAGSANTPIAHDDLKALLKLVKELERSGSATGKKYLLTETDPFPRDTDRSVVDLEKSGFTRITVRHMGKWNIGIDDLDKMAERAVMDDRIHNDYVFKRRMLKIKHLWARLKDG
jgi:hypothetical protein